MALDVFITMSRVYEHSPTQRKDTKLLSLRCLRFQKACLKESTGQDQLEGFAFEGGNRHEKVKSLHDILCGEVTLLAGRLPGDSDVLEKTQDIFSYLVSFFSRIGFREPLNMF